MTYEPKFFVVWAENGGAPTVKHIDRETAYREARRLALANPGIRFIVLEPVVAVLKNDLITTTFKRQPPWPRDDDDRIPF